MHLKCCHISLFVPNGLAYATPYSIQFILASMRHDDVRLYQPSMKVGELSFLLMAAVSILVVIVQVLLLDARPWACSGQALLLLL